MYSAFDHWAYWSHMLTAISMFSPCTQWVFGPLSPVSVVKLVCSIKILSYTNHERWRWESVSHPGSSLSQCQWVLRSGAVSDSANKIFIPLVRPNAFVHDEHRIRIVSLLDCSELVVVNSEERFLPVEFISRSLRTRGREVSRRVVNRRGTLTSLRYAPDSGAMPSRIFIS